MWPYTKVFRTDNFYCTFILDPICIYICFSIVRQYTLIKQRHNIFEIFILPRYFRSVKEMYNTIFEVEEKIVFGILWIFYKYWGFNGGKVIGKISKHLHVHLRFVDVIERDLGAKNFLAVSSVRLRKTIRSYKRTVSRFCRSSLLFYL